MKKLHFPKAFEHKHPPVKNVNKLFDEQLTFGQRSADWIANSIGNWKFIIIQSILLTLWVILNVTAWIYHWDPYPFILMNLTLSLQAAYTAPLIMMSQNRQAAKDRLDAHNDFLVNKRTEKESRVILSHLSAQNEALMVIHQMLSDRQNSLLESNQETSS